MADASRDQNFVPTLLGVSNVDGVTPVKVYADPVTHRLLIDSSGGGSGTVTDVSVVTANGFAGTVATSTTTPAITLSTTITGVLKGDGTAISTASPSTDYAAFAFKTISVATQSDVVADTPIDTLTLVAGTGMTITTNAGTDTITFAASGGAATSITVGTTTITSGTTTRILYDNAGVLGEYTITGTGTVVAMQTSPTFVTDITTPIVKLSGTSNQAVFQSGGVTGTLTWTPTSTNKTITFPDRTLTVDNITTATTTNGTGYLKGNGTAISFDNSTFLTTLTVGSTTITSGTNTRILYDNSGTLGEYTITGTGTVVAMATSPTFITGLTTPQVLATANDSGALGASGTAFSDLFLASGGVINWAANNSNITHSTGILTVGAGEFRITSANVGTNADSVPTLSSTSTMTNKTLTSPTIQTSPVLAAATNLKFTVPTADPSATGITTNEFNSGYSSTAIGDLVYLDSSATWQKADADASAATYSSMLGIALSVAASAAPVNVLLQGFVYAATPFPTFTIGAPIYMSATAGAVTQTAPVTTDSATRILGYAIHADKMYFNPSNDWITHT